MILTMAPADMAARPAGPPPHVRIPKLAYRNPLPADQASLSSQNTSDSETHSMKTAPGHRLSSTSSAATSSPVRPSFETGSAASTSLASSNGSTSKDSKGSKKKKANNMLGFLTLKEPSQSALEQFAEHQRKQAAEKGAKANPTGLNTASTQKLPASVPKVNSKWDGIPDAVKKKEATAKKRLSTSTQATSRFSSPPNESIFSLTSNFSCGPPNSLASGANSISSFSTDSFNATSERRDSGPSLTEQEKAELHMSSPSTTSLPEITYFFPDNPNSAGALESSPQTSKPITTSASAPSSPVDVSLHPRTFDESAIVALTTPPVVPASYSANTATVTPDVIKRRSLQGFLAGEAREMELSDDDSDMADDSHDFLFELQRTTADHSPLPSPTIDSSGRLPTMNFSRPRLNQQPLNPVPNFSRVSPAHTPTRPGFSGLPTLYEASITSSNDTSETIAELSEVNQQPKDSDTVSITPSEASSVTPSVMSATWYRSSRERLGLGGRIRKNDVDMPWESSSGGSQPDSQHQPASPTDVSYQSTKTSDNSLKGNFVLQPPLPPRSALRVPDTTLDDDTAGKGTNLRSSTKLLRV